MSTIVKRKRNVLIKPSKGGCRTCRERRIKCDGARPQCRNCSMKGRDCIYVNPRRLSNHVRTIIPALERHSKNNIVPKPLPYGIALNPNEAISLQYFALELLPVLRNESPYPILTQMALQYSIEVPTVRKAMVALTSSHRSRIYGHDCTLTPVARQRSVEHPHKLYDQALFSLNMHINEIVISNASVVPVIISSVFLLLFELFQGRQPLAQMHLTSLKHIISNHIHGSDGTYRAVKDRDLLNEVQLGFRGIDLPHALVPAVAPADYSRNLLTDVEMLEQEVQDFREQINAIGRSVMSQRDMPPMSDGMQHCFASCVGRTVVMQRDRSLQLRHQKLVNDHRAIQKRLTMLSNCDHDQISRITHIQHFFLSTVLERQYPIAEYHDERFERACEQILAVCDDYLRHISAARESDSAFGPYKPPTHAVISMRLNICRALYYIALMSNLQGTREAAIDLLRKANRREGTLPSHFLAQFAITMDCILRQDCHEQSRLSATATARPHEIVVAHEHGRGEMLEVVCGRVIFKDDGMQDVELRSYQQRGRESENQSNDLDQCWRRSAVIVVPLGPSHA